MASSEEQTDWNICLYCQLDTGDPLVCPASSKRTIVGAGYISLAEDTSMLNELRKIPEEVVTRLKECGSFLETLQSKQAKFHKSCRSKYNKTMINRIRKTSSNVDNKDTSSNAGRLSRATCSAIIKECFFCGNLATDKETLHAVATLEIEKRIRDGAASLKREDLLIKMATGDLVAQEAMYHKSCLTNFYNQVRSCGRKLIESVSEPDFVNLALTELVMYMESSSEEVFKLSELRKMINNRLQQLQGDQALSISSHRLQDKLLKYFPGLRAQSDPPKPTILVFEKDIGRIVRNAAQQEVHDHYIEMANVANICRADMFNLKDTAFRGSLIHDVQDIPLSLLTLIRMLLHGPSIKNQSGEVGSVAVNSIAQLIMFNATKHSRTDTHLYRHTIKREPTLPLYIGLLVHTHTRQKKIIDKLAHHGLSVSYKRVLQCSKQISDAACQIYNEEEVVSPTALQTDVFCTAAFDNIDYNPSSVTAEGALHGTSISIVQHLDHGSISERRRTLPISEPNSSSSLRVNSLPSFYTDVAPYALKQKEPRIPPIHENCSVNFTVDLHDEKKMEDEWLGRVRDSIDTTEKNPKSISWAAYHACQQPDETKGISKSVLLPLLPDPSHSLAVVKHIICNVQKTIASLNPNQATVITMDQPLYTIAKIFQWNNQEQFGENKLVLLMGAFHVEMNFMVLIGDLLEKSGIISAFARAEVCGEGKAQSFLKASHPRRARYYHEILSAALYILSVHAYDTYKTENLSTNLDFEEWKQKQSTDSAAFYYWNMILSLEVLRATFVRSIRTSNFDLYLKTLKSMAPWFFAVNHTNYARWTTVHIRDMESLPVDSPEVHHAFSSGKFTIKKSNARFSSIALDQGHEQENKLVKSTGGAVGLTEDAAALRRWMIAGPEIASMLQEYETLHENYRENKEDILTESHHEESESHQKRFHKHVHSLVSTLVEMDNPLLDDKLQSVDNHVIVGEIAEERMRSLTSLGNAQYTQFVEDRIISRNVSIFSPIKRNNINIFGSTASSKTKQTDKLTMVKNDAAIFSKLYIACQYRQGDLDEFFKHENQPFPPSLSETGNIRLVAKSELLKCLEDKNEDEEDENESHVDTFNEDSVDCTASFLDGPAVVQMIRPGTNVTFDDYRKSFIDYVTNQKGNRVDVVFDVYYDDSLKNSTRVKRGTGLRQRVTSTGKLPKNWQKFLHSTENKVELFNFLADGLQQVQHNKTIIATKGEEVLSNDASDISSLKSKQEEADTRILLHVFHAVRHGHANIIIRTVDTDVVVIAVSSYEELKKMKLNKLWISFGVGKTSRIIAVHQLVATLGPDRCSGILFFHAFTGCDTVSGFCGKGKKSFWKTWKLFPEVTKVFKELSLPVNKIESHHLDVLARYVILTYDNTSDVEDIDQARKVLFVKGRAMDRLPPTFGALLQHTKRACLQAGWVWAQCWVANPEHPNFEDWGWKQEDGAWNPLWSMKKETSASVKELTKCSCRSCIVGRCICRKSGLPCTGLCKCGGDSCDVN